jgi:hypothetical protein
MKPVLLILFSYFCLNVQAQGNNSVKELLTRTETSIYKAQKEIIAGHTTKQPMELSLAIVFQVMAVESFKNNELKLATCYSLKAREYSNRILVQMKLKGMDYYMLNADELVLSKQYNFNSNDEVFKLKAISKPIDDSILFDTQKLHTSYLISTN